MSTLDTPQGMVDDLLALAAHDWLTRQGGGVLHALGTGTPDVEDWCFTDGEFACELPFLTAHVPGLGERLGAVRCLHCCAAVYMPRGVGSPKNDDACRRVLGLPPTPKPPPLGPTGAPAGRIRVPAVQRPPVPPSLLTSAIGALAGLLRSRRWWTR